MKTQKAERLSIERERAFVAAQHELPRFTTVATMPEVSRQRRVLICKFYPHMEAVFASCGYYL